MGSEAEVLWDMSVVLAQSMPNAGLFCLGGCELPVASGGTCKSRKEELQGYCSSEKPTYISLQIYLIGCFPHEIQATV